MLLDDSLAAADCFPHGHETVRVTRHNKVVDLAQAEYRVVLVDIRYI